ncbi:MAG TPA: amidase [Acidimicrobiales bacterium]|nr:amidase [Acidimicrobiales bacterium]
MAPVPAATGATRVAEVAGGQRSIAEVAEEALGAVEDADPAIGAFHLVDRRVVADQVARLQAGTTGPLRGLVVGVKDLIDTADLPTGYGSPLFDDHRPEADAEVVAALRRHGALVLGKTESTEFALFQPARTRNPWDLTRTPGGSSSGSAAAVAAGMVPVALGTQTAGSVVRPAAYCGVYGFKPARDWTPTRGIWRLAEHLDTVGIFARSVEDLALVHRSLTRPGCTPTPAATDPRPRSVGLLPATEWAEVPPDAHAALSFLGDLLGRAGWKVATTTMPARWHDLPRRHTTVMAVEVSRNLHRSLGDLLAKVSASTRAVVAAGDACPASDYRAALAAAEEASREAAALAGSFDLLLAPSALGAAPRGLDSTGDPVLCRPFTLLGLPAANIPAYRRGDGLPVGVQAVGLDGDDRALLGALASIEAVLADGERRGSEQP